VAERSPPPRRRERMPPRLRTGRGHGPPRARRGRVGFLIIFAPSGLGVREILLAAALSPLAGAATVTAVALLSRVLATASDLLSAGAGAALRVPAAPPTAKEVTVETAEH
jgi:hypothetical protein